MTTQMLFELIEGWGGGLWIDGDQIRFRIPERMITDGMLETLKEHKLEIIQFLKGRQPKPYLTPQEGLVIPFDSDPKYWWWARGQSIRETKDEIRESSINS